MKTTAAYEAVMAARAIRATGLDDLPLTPDPTDETVCKPQWEREFMVWRKKVKEFSRSGTTTGEMENDRDDAEISKV